MNNFLSSFPDAELLPQAAEMSLVNINGHIHSPYSFSAFQNIEEVFELAKKEDIKAVGINDFIVTDGYHPFHDQAIKNKVFPFFNIEFMGLIKDAKQNGIRVNDPSNAGRTYFSGKALDFPATSTASLEILNRVKEESNRQTREMAEKVDQLLIQNEVPFRISFEEIREEFAEELVRERHIAKAIRQKVFDQTPEAADRIHIFQQIFSGQELTSDVNDINQLENEIRSKLLKSGGAAFVPEDEQAFLEISKVIEIIRDLGGIPTYPVLLDDKIGQFTEFEADFEHLKEVLKSMKVRSVELIPGRNDKAILKQFVDLFVADHFIVTLGTEHNTSEMIPLKVDTRGGLDLDDDMKRVNYHGACVLAAHQYLRAKKLDGYLDAEGNARFKEIDSFASIGASVFKYFFNN